MKQNKTKLFTILFFAVSFIDIVGVTTDSSWLQVIFKPMIVIFLIAMYYSSVEKINKWYMFALLFSLLGDVLLMDKVNHFIFGIAAFLITQILFIKIINGQIPKSNIGQKIIAIVPFLIYYFVLMYVLKDNLNELFYPVAVYGFTISLFGTVSLLNYNVQKNKLSKNLLLGSTLFILSDSLIALNKFYEPELYYPVIIMLTYVLAQYFIYKFMIGKSEE